MRLDGLTFVLHEAGLAVARTGSHGMRRVAHLPEVATLTAAIRESELGAHPRAPTHDFTILPDPLVPSVLNVMAGALGCWLAERAATIGAEQALTELEAYASSPTHEYLTFLALNGLELREVSRLSDSLELWPWHLVLDHDHSGEHATIEGESPHAAIVIRLDTKADEQHPPFARLMNAHRALVVAGAAGVVRTVAGTIHPPHVPITSSYRVPFGFVSQATYHPIPWSDEMRVVAAEMLGLLTSAGEDVQATIRIVADRATTASANWSSLPDCFIDLGIACEALFLHDESSTAELRFRTALRAARFVGEGVEERERIFGDVQAVYDLRSKAVHTGRLAKLPNDPAGLATRVASVVTAGMRRVLREGFPNWGRLILE
jgi:hypothetical protein